MREATKTWSPGHLPNG